MVSIPRYRPCSVTVDERFLLDPFEPCYLAMSRENLQARVERGLKELADCHACPRDCGVNRLANETKVCNTGRHARVASAFPHFGEEDCLRGWNGSGTIFFSFCNLRCVFCQNWDISQQAAGKEMDAGEIAEVMLALQARGCHNINLVTPEHVAPQVVEAIAAAIPRGLRLPIVYNTSAYDSLASLRLLDGLVDIYMPDFKFWRMETARELSKAKDYPERARTAILEMHRQVGPLQFGPDGLARRGVLVRHLVMPGQEDEAAAIFAWLVTEVSADTYVNVMGQYRPDFQVTSSRDRTGNLRYRDINRLPAAKELQDAVAAARTAGLRLDKRWL